MATYQVFQKRKSVRAIFLFLFFFTRLKSLLIRGMEMELSHSFERELIQSQFKDIFRISDAD